MKRTPRTSESITLRALITARWVTIAIIAALGAVFGGWVPGLDSPELHLLGGRIDVLGWYALVAAWAAVNVAASRTLAWLATKPAAAGLSLIIDTAVLSAFLALSGGAANPFTILYFVPVMLATQVSPRWTWGVAAFCLLCFGLLFAIRNGAAGPHSHHFSAHLKGMWLAFAVAGGLITVFVHRIAVAISRSRHELLMLRETALRDRQLAQIGGLAAGAAHELGTPLATMTVLVGELSAMDADEREDSIAEVKRQLARCKHIVSAMANSELRADALSPIEVEPWSAEVVGIELEGDIDVRVDTDRSRNIAAPKQAVSQILRELVANAKSHADRVNVCLRIEADDEHVRLTVEDDGPGMKTEVAEMARDPFFTTREAQGHMGLGLFLAHAQAQQLGGTLEVATTDGVGTQVSLVLPRIDEAAT